MRNEFLLTALLVSSLQSFAQSDLTVGTSYQLNLQRQNSHADAWILHNAEYSSGNDLLKWETTSSNFGYRGIRFAYSTGRGIYFYAQEEATTAGGEFTPITRFFIGNNGNIGVGTSSPAEVIHINGNGRVNARIGRWASLGETYSGLATIIGTNVKASNEAIHRMEIIESTVDGGKAIKMQYNEGISFHTYLGNVSAGSEFAGYERMRIDNNGNVGIGILPSPDNRLHVAGRLVAENEGVYASGDKGSIIMASHTGYYSKPTIYSVTTSGIVNDLLINPAGGNVGIGTTTPGSKLTVKGHIHAEEVRVDLNVPGPDYVFEEDYNLPSLSEIENYIKDNKHLPEVPSAKEMKTNGINLSEMNMLLLKKVEELTLHLIEMKKLVDTQQKEINYLKSK